MLELQARNKRQQVPIQSFPLQGPLKVGTTFIQRLNTLQIVRKILTSDHDGLFLDHSMGKPDAKTLRKVREEDEKRTALTSKQEEEELST